MKSLALFSFFLCNIASAACLNISGTFDMGHPGGLPACAHGIRVIKAWYKYQQTECAELSVTKVYKMVDGNFCEGYTSVNVTDGMEHASANPEYAYTYEAMPDRHVISYKNIPTGKVTKVTKMLDSQGNLEVDGSDGNHEVFQKEESSHAQKP